MMGKRKRLVPYSDSESDDDSSKKKYLKKEESDPPPKKNLYEWSQKVIVKMISYPRKNLYE